MPIPRKENAACQYNLPGDQSCSHNHRLGTFLSLYWHDARNHYPSEAQTTRRYKPVQGGNKEKYMCVAKELEDSNFKISAK